MRTGVTLCRKAEEVRMDALARRLTVPVRVGGVQIGGGAPVVVQSMTNTDTGDVETTARQVQELAEAGSEIVRITVNGAAAAKAVPEIARRLEDEGCPVPLVGDFHYNGHLLLKRHPECATTLAKSTGSTPATSVTASDGTSSSPPSARSPSTTASPCASGSTAAPSTRIW